MDMTCIIILSNDERKHDMSQELNEFQRLLVNDETCRKEFIEFGVAVFSDAIKYQMNIWHTRHVYDDSQVPDVRFQSSVRSMLLEPYFIFENLVHDIHEYSMPYSVQTMLKHCKENSKVGDYIRQHLANMSEPNEFALDTFGLQIALNWYKYEIFQECISLFDAYIDERNALQEMLNM